MAFLTKTARLFSIDRLRSRWRIRLTLVWASLLPLLGSAQVFREYDLKALFLYNFAQFVEWPPEALANQTPLIIGVVGQDRFGKSLDDLTKSDAARRRKLHIERYRKFTEIQNCHILFIDRSESKDLDEILHQVHGMPVLTVSDIDGFTGRGGMIQFITEQKAGEEKKIRLRINVAAAKAANLTISSKLLKLAEIDQ